MLNLKCRALPPRREHRSPAQLDPATRRLTLAWRQQRRPSPNLQARWARRPRPSRLPRPALLVACSRRATSRPLLIVRPRLPSLGPSTAPSRPLTHLCPLPYTLSVPSTPPPTLRLPGRALQPSQCPLPS